MSNLIPFRSFVAAGVDVENLTGDPSSWPAGSSDGAYGVTTSGVVYRYKSAITRWVRAEYYSYTFTQQGDTLGASGSPSGWAKTGANITSDGTTLTLGVSTPNSDASYLSQSLGASRIYLCGHFSCTTSTGSETRQALLADQIDGAKRLIFGCKSDQTLSASNDGTPGVGANNYPDMSSEVWCEAVFEPSDNAMAWVSHAKFPNSVIAYEDASSVVLDRFAVGDATSAGAGVTTFRDFRVYTLA